RERQLADGGWSLYEGGPANLSATIKAYFALKVAGVSVDDPALAQARTRILDWGGPVEANVFTKVLLALFGEYDWRGLPSMPVEIMLLPRWSYFNLLEVSYWSRTVIVPLLVLMDCKPVKRLPESCRLDELWPVPREKASLRLKRIPRPFSPKRFIWKNLFIGVDDALKGWERLGPRQFCGPALDAGRRRLRGGVGGDGGSGRYLPRHGQCRCGPAHPGLSGGSSAHHRAAQGDREPRRGDARGAPLPALRLASVGHLARRQRAPRVRAARGSSAARARGGMDDGQADHRARRLAREAAPRASWRLAVPVSQRLLS